MPKIVYKESPEKGKKFNFFSWASLQIGQSVILSHPTGYASAKVVKDYSSEERYTSNVVDNSSDTGFRKSNLGRGYYEAEVE